MPFTVEIHQLFGPEPAQQRYLLLDPVAAISEIHAQRLELRGAPANADAQHYTPTCQNIDFGGLLGHQFRLPLRQHHVGGDQLYFFREAGDPREQGHGFVKTVFDGVMHGPGRVPGILGAENMIHQSQALEAKILRRGNKVTNNGGVVADLGLWE